MFKLPMLNCPQGEDADHEATIIFVEELNGLHLFFCLLPRLFIRLIRARLDFRNIYYFDATPLGVWAARILGLFLGVSVQSFDFKLLDVKDRDGNWLRLRIEFEDMVALHKQIVSRQDFLDFVAQIKREPCFQESRIGEYLNKQVMSFTWMETDTIWRAMLLVQILVWARGDHPGWVDHRLELFLNARPWMDELKEYAAQNNVCILEVLRPRIDLQRFVFGFISENRVRALYYRFLEVRARYSHMKLKNFHLPRKGPGGKILVEYYGHLNLDDPQYYSDLFFYQHSDLKGEDLSLSFNIPVDALDEKKIQQLVQHAIEPIVLNPRANKVAEVKTFQHAYARTRKPDMPFMRGRQNQKHLYKHVVDYQEKFDYWSHLFESCDIKIYISWFKYSGLHCVIADAIRHVGGISVLYQRAYDDFPSPSLMTVADVVFGFSRKGIEVERGSHSVIPYYVIAGYSGDCRFEVLKPYAAEVKKALASKGAKKIIAYFDENSAEDERFNSGHEFMRANYRFLLNKIMEREDLGLVIKPKVPRTLRSRLGDMGGLLRAAEETGRCFVFEGGALHGAYPPAIAALSADLAIHGHLCAATAGLEAALTGTPTLLLDREGWPRSTLFRLPKGKVTFSTWEDLWAACEEHWRSPRGMLGFGDWSVIMDEMDPFRDGKAAERIGTYLLWLKEDLGRGLRREDALELAAQRYQKIWGKDKIVSI